jgi:hypothetical protein
MTDEKILPEEPNEAMKTMIQLTQECLNVLEAEGDKITRNDMVQFTVNDENKGRTFIFYEKAVNEFKERLDELQGKVDPVLITELQTLQLRVADQAANNNARLEAIEGLIENKG